MKRWEVVTSDGYRLELFFNTYEEVKLLYPNCDIVESDNYEYLDYITKIKDKAINSKVDYKGRDILELNIPNGKVYIRLFKEDIYLDGLSYQIWNYNRLYNPITWTMSNPKDFYKKYLVDNENVNYKIYSFRKYGQPKLSKPKELKGIDQVFSIDYIPKHCKCQCFIKDNDLYIKHRDYFSESLRKPEDIGTPLEYRIKKYGINSKKNSGFVYNDCWGDIVLRNEAWIVIENIISQAKRVNEQELTREITKKFADCKHHRMQWNDIGSTWVLFWSNLVHELYKYIEENKL